MATTSLLQFVSSFISSSAARSGELLFRGFLLVEALGGLPLRVATIVVDKGGVVSGKCWGINIVKERRSIKDDAIESCEHTPIVSTE